MLFARELIEMFPGFSIFGKHHEKGKMMRMQLCYGKKCRMV